jgi:ketosteroid isomerase-like protein
VPAVLDALADDVAWEQWEDSYAQRAGVPWLEERHGHDGAAEFLAIVGGWEIAEFTVRSLMAGGDQVAAEIVIDATTADGAHLRDEELHVWSFDASGKVTRLRHYSDTAKHIAAAQGAAHTA